jgi:hypothetical protein
MEVKFSLCLTKYHAMKKLSLVNWGPHYEDVLGNGEDIAPRREGSAQLPAPAALTPAKRPSVPIE